MIASLVFFPMAAAILRCLIGRTRLRAGNAMMQLCAAAELLLAVFLLFSENAALSFGSFCGLGLHFQADGFRKVYALMIAFLWLGTLIFSEEYFSSGKRLVRYGTAQLLTLGATMGVFFSADLLTAFTFFEVMSLASYVWVIHDETPKAIRAANTYLAVAVIGGLAALYGIFLLQWRLGTTEIDRLAALAAGCEDKGALYAAGGCILFGFGAKAGMFPLHIWLPKAHPVAPAPASALLSGILTKTGVWGVLAVSCSVFRHDPAWGAVIVAFGTATMLLGAVLALLSIDLKRTLACSSMSQIGFILVGIGMMCLLGEENALAGRGVLLHMLNHSLFKLILFLCAGTVYMNLHRLDLNELRGWGRRKPLLAAAFLLASLGIMGIPGTGGYISKTLLHESIAEGVPHYGAWLKLTEWLFLISGGFTVAYMTKLFVAVFVEKHPVRQAEFDEKKSYVRKKSAAAFVLPALAIPVLGLIPSVTMDRIASFGTDFFRIGEQEHPVAYYSFENLKGAAISVSIGILLYLTVVRKLLMRDGRYIDRLPQKLDLETLLYRPLLRMFACAFGAVCRVFGESKISAVLSAAAFRFAAFCARQFGENRLSSGASRGGFFLAGLLAEGTASNRITAPLLRGIKACTGKSCKAMDRSVDAGIGALNTVILHKQDPDRNTL